MTDVHCKNVGDVLAHGNSTLAGFALHDLVNDPARPRHDLGAVTFVWLSHVLTLPKPRLYLITTRRQRAMFS